MIGCFIVAPYLGAWIEISSTGNSSQVMTVAPYLGAWIEIAYFTARAAIVSSRSLLGGVD